MIAVDTSALIAILMDEPKAAACRVALANSGELLISAGTISEALIVAAGRKLTDQMVRLIDGLGAEIVPVTEVTAKRIGIAYERWGKGFHPAGLNFGDCFAYDVAIQQGCPLLFVGQDFAQTDVAAALG